MFNLFIAYDLIPPGQNYEAIRERIRALGRWHQFQYSLFYVHTDLCADQAFSYVSEVMDPNDKLIVIDARGGVVSTGDRPPIDAINAIWSAE